MRAVRLPFFVSLSSLLTHQTHEVLLVIESPLLAAQARERMEKDSHDPFQWFLKSIVPADTSSPVLDSLSPDTDTSKSSEGTSCS